MVIRRCVASGLQPRPPWSAKHTHTHPTQQQKPVRVWRKKNSSPPLTIFFLAPKTTQTQSTILPALCLIEWCPQTAEGLIGHHSASVKTKQNKTKQNKTKQNKTKQKSHAHTHGHRENIRMSIRTSVSANSVSFLSYKWPAAGGGGDERNTPWTRPRKHRSSKTWLCFLFFGLMCWLSLRRTIQL